MIRSRHEVWRNGKRIIDTPWEHDYWTPEPWFRDQTVFVLASGPSLTQEICDKIRRRPAIVVNASAVTFNFDGWWPVWFFTDGHIYETYREQISSWPGEIVTMSRGAKQELDKQVKRVRGEGDPSHPAYSLQEFPPIGHHSIRQGRSSGHTAVSLAIALGASRIALVGFDMRVVINDGEAREHHHREYKGPRDIDIYEREFVPAFNGWSAAALRRGVEILNCTPDSAVKEFPFACLDEVLVA